MLFHYYDIQIIMPPNSINSEATLKQQRKQHTKQLLLITGMMMGQCNSEDCTLLFCFNQQICLYKQIVLVL